MFTGLQKLLTAGICFGLAFNLLAEAVFYQVPLADVEITSGTLPTVKKAKPLPYYRDFWRMRDYMQPYIVGKQNTEMYLAYVNVNQWNRVWRPSRSPGVCVNETSIVVKAKEGETPKGVVFLPNPDWNGMNRIEFSIPAAEKPHPETRKSFYEAKKAHYQSLMKMNIPGAAWFRHQVREADLALGKKDKLTRSNNRNRRRRREPELQRTYSLFSGGRALSENLQLDRELRISKPAKSTIPIDTIAGITTAGYDWKKLIADKNPQLDPLAQYIPDDQYVIFFPTFQAMIKLMDEAELRGTPILQLIEPRSEDGLTRKRYQRQLCLPVSELSRILGSKLIAGVAFTGSDPYMRTGTDLAVIFAAKDAKTLGATIKTHQGIGGASVPGTKVIKGKISGVDYSGVRSPRREVCSYMAVLDNSVMVSNSLVQLDNLIKTKQGKSPSIASLDEYIFFRDRYPLGKDHEVALIVISDKTIRKWCGPQWRISDARRTQVAALMAELQAEYLTKLAAGEIKASTDLECPLPFAGELKVTPTGIFSSKYNTLEFLTPISEIPLEKVTEQEKRAYDWFRKGYQNNWQVFDPIAIRFSLTNNRMGGDMTVRPLIAASNYRELMEITKDGGIQPYSGDPHPKALLRFIMSLDPESQPVRSAANLMMGMTPKMGRDGLNWIGNSLSIHVDQDPLWEEAREEAKKNGEYNLEKFMEKNLHRLPVAIQIEVKSAMKLTLFLTSLRAFVEQSSPGLTYWETLEHNKQPYVKVSQKEKSREDSALDKLAIYYAATPDRLILTLNERVLTNALDRMTIPAKKAVPGKATGGLPWLGKSLGIQATPGAIQVIRTLYRGELSREMARWAWANLFILNEWRRLFPKSDPVAFHEQHWQVRLLDPGYGKYVWNDQFQTMESTTFGCPASPKKLSRLPDPLADIKNANFGLTFEDDGLRARAEIIRKSLNKEK